MQMHTTAAVCSQTLCSSLCTAEVKHPSKFKNQPDKVGVTFMHSSPPCLCSSTIICFQWGRVFKAYRKWGILESLTQVGPGWGQWGSVSALFVALCSSLGRLVRSVWGPADWLWAPNLLSRHQRLRTTKQDLGLVRKLKAWPLSQTCGRLVHVGYWSDADNTTIW